MSFSSKIKDEIIGTSIRNPCCRRALLHGVVSSKAIISDGIIIIRVESVSVASYIAGLIKEFFGRDAYIGTSQKGGRCRYISFKSNSCEKFITDVITRANNMFLSKCASCNSYFLKGVFLACGRVSEPQKQYCLEFSFENRCDLFIDYFASLGLFLKKRERNCEIVTYTKNSSCIEDFFALAEMQSAAYEIINTKITKEFVNNANRGRNLDTVNIRKAVETGNEQARLLLELEKRGLLGKLPDDLLRTAKLRMEFPDYTLNQIAIHSVPPLTKSGAVHRLAKIMKLAKELLNN